ncbi:MAG: MgtC/SapB family protein [Treponema sp.]|nr:MgtC/SapB family protein [Treponema sp.]
MILDYDFIKECFLKFFLSVIAGIVMGLERKTRNQVVGMRTLVLISVSSSLWSVISYALTEIQVAKGFYGGDPTRIIAGVVSGIGFIGGGAILHQGLNVKGLTSAAIIWTTAAIGTAIGVGLYAEAAFILIIAVFLLLFLEKVEDKFFPAGKNKTLHIIYDNEDIDMEKVKETIERHGFIVKDLNMSRIMASNQIILRYIVKSPSKDDFTDLINELKKISSLSEFSVTDK